MSSVVLRYETGLRPERRPGNLLGVPDRISGSVDLWDGWRLALPNECMAERNADGSWSAWDASHTIDVHIITVAGTETGLPIDAAAMLGGPSNTAGEGWTGAAQELSEPDAEGPAYRFAISAAASNTLMSCWVAYRQPEGRTWAEAVCRGIEHEPPGTKRRLFRRR